MRRSGSSRPWGRIRSTANDHGMRDDGVDLHVAAARAGDAIGPAVPDEVGAARILVGKRLFELREWSFGGSASWLCAWPWLPSILEQILPWSEPVKSSIIALIRTVPNAKRRT